MASGLQCPGCGHVHPAGLPEIARGDATFRCYGCYRTLSIPEGWSGRPTPRPSAADMTLTGEAPPGAGTRDARSARLAGRRGTRASALTGPMPAAPPGDLPTQMVPPTSLDRSPPTGAVATADPPPGHSGAAPLGWVAPRRSGTAVGTTMRAGVWFGAFLVGLVVTAFILRKMGVLDVDAVIDLYAGSGAGRFGILMVLLPMWALLSATIAHFSLEALAKRRQPRPAPQRPPAAG